VKQKSQTAYLKRFGFLNCDLKGRKIKLLWGFKYANQLGVYQPKNVGKEKVNDTKSSI
jgi:hypothetical protein